MYSVTFDGQIKRDGIFIDPASFPEYLDWLAQGNIPELAEKVRITAEKEIMFSGGDSNHIFVRAMPNQPLTLSYSIGDTTDTIELPIDADCLCEFEFICETPMTRVIFSYGDVSCEVIVL